MSCLVLVVTNIVLFVACNWQAATDRFSQGEIALFRIRLRRKGYMFQDFQPDASSQKLTLNHILPKQNNAKTLLNTKFSYFPFLNKSLVLS